MTRPKIDYGQIVASIKDLTRENQGELAARFGVSQATVSRWINGGQEPEKDSHQKILQEAEELGIVNVGSTTQARTVPIVGYVGAGGAVLFAEGQGPFGEARMPPKGASEYTVAVIVRGGSMAGHAEDGWLVYYDTRRDPPTPEMMGKLCVVGLRDQRVLVKKLLQGTKPGRYHLISTSDPILMDQEVEWAARVNWIEPQ